MLMRSGDNTLKCRVIHAVFQLQNPGYKAQEKHAPCWLLSFRSAIAVAGLPQVKPGYHSWAQKR
eukprot:1157304-Pelagomonas_calceolata.AAC.9